MYKIARFRVFILIFFAVLIRASFLENIKIAGIKPDIAIPIVIFSGLFGGPRLGAETGIFAGFLTDVLGIFGFGIGIISYGICGALAGFLNKRFYKESFLTQSILTGLLTFLIYSIFYLLRLVNPGINIYAYKRPFFDQALFIIVLYNSILAPLVFKISYSIFGFKKVH